MEGAGGGLLMWSVPCNRSAICRAYRFGLAGEQFLQFRPPAFHATSATRDCVTMSLRGSVATEAISRLSDKKKIATLLVGARNDKELIATLYPAEDKSVTLI